MLSVGIDVALEEHQVEIQNDKEEVLWRKRLENNKRGLEELCAKLDEIKRKIGDPDVVGIFAEAAGSYYIPFQHHLTQRGYRFVAVNPLEVKSARAIKNLDRIKDDKIDAHTLASLPWMDKKYREENTHQRHEISELTRLYQKTLTHQTRLQNCIRSDIAKVFPELLQFIKDIDTKTNIALLKKYPTPSKILEAHEKELIALVKKKSRGAFGAEFVKSVRALAENTIGIPDPNGVMAYRLQFLVERLVETKNALAQIANEIKKRTDNNEEVKMIDDIRGIERVRAASLYCEVGSIEQFETARKLQGYGGITPKMLASAKKEWIGGPTKISNHYLRETVSVCAKSLALHSDEFMAVYAREKMKGKSDTQAYIIVGNRLLYHVFTILKNKKPYRKRMPQKMWPYPHPIVSSRQAKK